MKLIIQAERVDKELTSVTKLVSKDANKENIMLMNQMSDRDITLTYILRLCVWDTM